MISKKIPRILIAATGSGSGKTTISTAIMGALIKKGLRVKGYKCGPDYIDSMFHKYITKENSTNLDSFFVEDNTLKYILANYFGDCQIGIIEGVMGYYDGAGDNSFASAYEISKKTKTPTILLINPSGMARSVAAVIKGFVEFEKDNYIRGIILNSTSKGMYEYYKTIIEKEVNVKVLGYMPKIEGASLESRYLGLKMAGEVGDLDEKIQLLVNQCLDSVNIDEICNIANSAEDIVYEDLKIDKIGEFNLAVAQDESFCFYYEENLDILRKLGANLVFFSPMKDKEIPQNAHGIYFGGGYPEMHLEELSNNTTLKNSVRIAYESKMPIFAECGGFMYLMNRIVDKEGKSYNTVGIIDGEASMTNKLCRFGYLDIISKNNGIMAKHKDCIKGHEFHYSDSSNNGRDFELIKTNGKKYEGIIMQDNLFAGYPHLYFYSNIEFPVNFSRKCIEFKESM